MTSRKTPRIESRIWVKCAIYVCAPNKQTYYQSNPATWGENNKQQSQCNEKDAQKCGTAATTTVPPIDGFQIRHTLKCTVNWGEILSVSRLILPASENDPVPAPRTPGVSFRCRCLIVVTSRLMCATYAFRAGLSRSNTTRRHMARMRATSSAAEVVHFV